MKRATPRYFAWQPWALRRNPVYLFRTMVELVALRRVGPRTAAQRYPLGLHPVSSAAERGGVVAARQPLPPNTCNPFGIPIRHFLNSFGLKAALLLAAFALTSCDNPSGASANAGEDPQVKSLGTVEVTARLVEIPDGAIFQRDLYDYATILKYEVLAVRRGAVEKGATIYVGHYNPWKPRAEAADQRAKNIGGTLKQFRAGQLHRMALETPMDDHFMGGIVDKYFGKHDGPSYWAVWTNAAD